MDLADQIFVTGTTLVLEELRINREDLPVSYDEVLLRESEPADSYRLAISLVDAYTAQPPAPGSDGIDVHARIANMARELAERIAKYHPEVVTGDR